MSCNNHPQKNWCPGPIQVFAAQRRCLVCENVFRANQVAGPVVAPPIQQAMNLLAVPGLTSAATPSVHPNRPVGNLGCGERFKLVKNLTNLPGGGTLKWSASGNAELATDTGDGTKSIFVAGPEAGSATATLLVDGGPNHGRKVAEYPFTVLVPSGWQASRAVGSQLRHTNGMAGVGFLMWVNILPATVPFDKVELREHTGLFFGTGEFRTENGRVHAPTGQGYDNSGQPLSTLSRDWLSIIASDNQKGINAMNGEDEVSTPDFSPNNTGQWQQSMMKWNIEWKYRVRLASGQYSSEKSLGHLMHEATITSAGRATISKGGAGPFFRDANMLTSNY